MVYFGALIGYSQRHCVQEIRAGSRGQELLLARIDSDWQPSCAAYGDEQGGLVAEGDNYRFYLCYFTLLPTRCESDVSRRRLDGANFRQANSDKPERPINDKQFRHGHERS